MSFDPWKIKVFQINVININHFQMVKCQKIHNHLAEVKKQTKNNLVIFLNKSCSIVIVIKDTQKKLKDSTYF